MTRRAYSYLRISSEGQKKGDGIRRQLDASRQYAEEHGYELVDTIQDIGVSAFSGANATEGKLGKFLNAINSGKVEPGSVLIVESLDRLSRDKVASALNQFTAILAKGITIVTLVDNQVYTSESVNENIGQLFLSIGVMLRANDESVTKSKRGKASWEQKRKKAKEKIIFKHCPIWLEVAEDKSEFRIKPTAKETIAAIFDMSIKGMGIFSIAKTLNANLSKYPVLGATKYWNTITIHRMLTNRMVLGEYQPSTTVNGKTVDVEEVIPNYYPAVIDVDTYNLAASRLKGRVVGKSGKKGETLSNLFTGLVKCGHCGGTVFMRGSSYIAQGHYLRCKNAISNNGNCTAPYWVYQEFEESFAKFVNDISFKELMQDKGSQDTLRNLQGLQASTQAAATELQKRYDSILDLLENPELTAMMKSSYTARAAKIEQELEATQKALEELEVQILRESTRDHQADQDELISMFQHVNGLVDTEQKRTMRFAMADIISRNIEEIQLHNVHHIEPWEAPEEIPDSVKAELNLKTDREVEKFFGNRNGSRFYTRYMRYFIVKFRSGTIRVVHPYTGLNFMSVDERMVKIRKGA